MRCDAMRCDAMRRYEQLEDAELALEKNGVLDALDGHMLGVKKCTSDGFGAPTSSAYTPSRTGLGARSRAGSGSALRAGMSPGHHRLHSSGGITRSIDRVPDIYKRHPRPANVCTRLFRYLFKT
jgi:hypothetical protein